MPLSILTPPFPNSHSNLTSRLLYRTFQPPAVRLKLAGEAVSPVTQVSRVQVLVCRQPSLRRLHSHPTQVSGCQFSRTEAPTRSALVGNTRSHHHQEIPQTLSVSGPKNSCFSSLHASGASRVSTLTPSCPLEPHQRGQPPNSSTQSLGQHLLSKMKTWVED